MFRYWLCFGSCLMAAGMQQVSHADVLTYSPGTGGTFNPTSPSTFTFTNFANDTISGTATYTAARLQFRWGGTTPYPGAFNITNLSLANPGTTTSMGDVSFLVDTAAGAVRSPTAFVPFSGSFGLGNLGPTGITATFTIPTLNVEDGWYLESRLQVISNFANPGDGDVNFSQWQRATALTPVPEPGSAVFLAGAAAAGYLRRRQSKKKAAAGATI